ncbi:hypothetical protein A3C89_02005 [Candidatus Kaiserbacteria bacterium RIFCSPHIGHO2_02_FULL_50_50]|uniref:Uncharacterized protein n=1 Tax=Candidatus Kaiserbacteria bacterium RIFCSPHIGHO2_02_FULL_50_50 TaxID=1798492 RepID=A0A1F6DCK9_9BACT|nr:MAG: hypothetical protein A3C89_02005 [Candidatus Kaiserbacteria bacterium RIFCSPHIGHO2_02_FULL_50_50]OGG88788.1 MAG: hypothetical protein A3G62_03760 [Candidatus Kaiserbacteria bacterium RIFCSPLOWO2_12_FULL_50_10]
MKKIYVITLGFVVFFMFVVGAYLAAPYIVNAYETRGWETFTNEEFGFTFKYPREMYVSEGASSATKGDAEKYTVVSARLQEDLYISPGYIAMYINEGDENLTEEYLDKKKISIHGRSWNYYTSGELMEYIPAVSTTGEYSPYGETRIENIYYWNTYVTRISSELHFEVSATYSNPKYNEIMDIMVRSIRFK